MNPQNPAPVEQPTPQVSQSPVAPEMPPQTPVVSGPPPKNTVLIVIIIVLVVLIGAAGAWFLLKGDNKKPTANSGTSKPTALEATPTPAAKTCLVKSDYNDFLGYENDNEYTAENMHSGNVHFLPDSSNYDDTVVTQSTLRDYAEFVKQHASSRQFTLLIEGSTNDANSDDSSAQLAQQRADKVKADLVALGASADNLKTKTVARTNDTALGKIDRVVIIYIDPTCNATPTSNTTTDDR